MFSSAEGVENIGFYINDTQMTHPVVSMEIKLISNRINLTSHTHRGLQLQVTVLIQ
jgi:hypothetical protein